MLRLEVINFLRGFAISTIVLMHCVQGYLDGVLHKLGIKRVDSFFSYTSKIGYEWYLVHSLTFIVVHHFVNGMMPMWMVLAVCLLTSYAVALFFSRLYKKLSIIKK